MIMSNRRWRSRGLMRGSSCRGGSIIIVINYKSLRGRMSCLLIMIKKEVITLTIKSWPITPRAEKLAIAEGAIWEVITITTTTLTTIMMKSMR